MISLIERWCHIFGSRSANSCAENSFGSSLDLMTTITAMQEGNSSDRRPSLCLRNQIRDIIAVWRNRNRNNTSLLTVSGWEGCSLASNTSNLDIRWKYRLVFINFLPRNRKMPDTTDRGTEDSRGRNRSDDRISEWITNPVKRVSTTSLIAILPPAPDGDTDIALTWFRLYKDQEYHPHH